MLSKRYQRHTKTGRSKICLFLLYSKGGGVLGNIMGLQGVSQGEMEDWRKEGWGGPVEIMKVYVDGTGNRQRQIHRDPSAPPARYICRLFVRRWRNHMTSARQGQGLKEGRRWLWLSSPKSLSYGETQHCYLLQCSVQILTAHSSVQCCSRDRHDEEARSSGHFRFS